MSILKLSLQTITHRGPRYVDSSDPVKQLFDFLDTNPNPQTQIWPHDDVTHVATWLRNAQYQICRARFLPRGDAIPMTGDRLYPSRSCRVCLCSTATTLYHCVLRESILGTHVPRFFSSIASAPMEPGRSIVVTCLWPQSDGRHLVYVYYEVVIGHSKESGLV